MNAKKLLTHIVLILAVTSLLVGFAPLPAQAAVANCTQYHTVQRGETLFKIGLRYGVTWRYLADLNNLNNANRIFAGQVLCVSTSGTTPPPAPAPAPTGFTFRIVSVVKDQTVTIETTNLPANDSFKVLLGAYGTKGVAGTKVDKINSGKGGKVTITANIPATLRGSDRIAIRMVSPTTGRYYYNWFYNRTVGSGTGTGDPSGNPGNPGYSGIPTFSIVSVARDNTVTIRTNNYPANVKFDVLMGAMGTKGVGGIKVDSINSGQGGTFTATFTIPAALRGSNRIAIRLESPNSVYYSYNWFYNK